MNKPSKEGKALPIKIVYLPLLYYTISTSLSTQRSITLLITLLLFIALGYHPGWSRQLKPELKEIVQHDKQVLYKQVKEDPYKWIVVPIAGVYISLDVFYKLTRVVVFSVLDGVVAIGKNLIELDYGVFGEHVSKIVLKGIELGNKFYLNHLSLILSKIFGSLSPLFDYLACIIKASSELFYSKLLTLNNTLQMFLIYIIGELQPFLNSLADKLIQILWPLSSYLKFHLKDLYLDGLALLATAKKYFDVLYKGIPWNNIESWVIDNASNLFNVIQLSSVKIQLYAFEIGSIVQTKVEKLIQHSLTKSLGSLVLEGFTFLVTKLFNLLIKLVNLTWFILSKVAPDLLLKALVILLDKIIPNVYKLCLLLTKFTRTVAVTCYDRIRFTILLFNDTILLPINIFFTHVYQTITSFILTYTNQLNQIVYQAYQAIQPTFETQIQLLNQWYEMMSDLIIKSIDNMSNMMTPIFNQMIMSYHYLQGHVVPSAQTLSSGLVKEVELIIASITNQLHDHIKSTVPDAYSNLNQNIDPSKKNV